MPIWIRQNNDTIGDFGELSLRNVTKVANGIIVHFPNMKRVSSNELLEECKKLREILDSYNPDICTYCNNPVIDVGPECAICGMILRCDEWCTIENKRCDSGIDHYDRGSYLCDQCALQCTQCTRYHCGECGCSIHGEGSL